MNVAYIVILLLAVLFIIRGPEQVEPKYARRRSDKRRKDSDGPGEQGAKYPYRGVSIVSDSLGCSGVQSLGRKCFLVGETPELPLQSCTSSRCNCIYAHHRDRRNGDRDRRHRRSMMSELFAESGQQERRALRGRRAADWPSAPAFTVQ